MANILASSIANKEHLAAFDEMVEARFAAIEIEAVLIYLIDTVESDALPILAEQFDVLGYKGFGLAQTESERREVIKKAIELHRYKGTPWSIKEALKAIGYYNAVINEDFEDDEIYHDSIHTYNGTQLYGPGHWADFSVLLDIGSTQGITAQTAAAAVALINEYKNVRSRLRYVSYAGTIQEYMSEVTETLTVSVISNLGDALGYYHDATYLYGSDITHGVVDDINNTQIIQ
jgi:P2-related tail formation protein